MRVSRLKTSLIFWAFLLTFFSITVTARADDDDEPDDYDVKARVVRISLMGGEVNLKRNGNQDWEPARLNYPLVEGDTVATDKDSRLEIQIDARNFVRLAANSTLRIVTLRDEGIALSVLEGTVSVRLARFDRKNGYFEIDAPRTTIAAEKEGLYRIDVPRDGRVRLTVRDGGSARIYSDTSGFALRDGRSAELVVSGDNMGDWEFFAAAPTDLIDDWVSEREQFLAQRLKQDVKYYDEYVWGAEDLDAYGDWNYTDDFGWIWRPHPTTISVFSDWAPYRYGHWTWCPPYGWTWVGYEPWGWAPYHYGRWVYHNNYWAWCPRSKFYKKRSWWRPALVAFVIDISFGDNVCWYPLSYYQRDPHSRRYRHDAMGAMGAMTVRVTVEVDGEMIALTMDHGEALLGCRVAISVIPTVVDARLRMRGLRGMFSTAIRKQGICRAVVNSAVTVQRDGIVTEMTIRVDHEDFRVVIFPIARRALQNVRQVLLWMTI